MANDLKVGGHTPDAIYLGSIVVDAVYLGSDKVWPANVATSPGVPYVGRWTWAGRDRDVIRNTPGAAGRNLGLPQLEFNPVDADGNHHARADFTNTSPVQLWWNGQTIAFDFTKSGETSHGGHAVYFIGPSWTIPIPERSTESVYVLQ